MDLRNILSASGSQFISQIIYPDVDLTALKGDAYLIGWNLDSFRCSIACIVPIAENRLVDLNDALSKSSKDLMGALSTCSKVGRSKPIVLGELIVSNDSSYIPSPDKQARCIWITLCYGKSDDSTQPLKPKLHSLYSLGCKYDTSVNIFRYQRAASQRLECFFVKRTYRNQKLQQDRKVDTSYNSDGVNSSSKSSPLTDLEVVIGHINTANELRNRLDFYLDSAAGRPINRAYYYLSEEPFVSSADQYFSQVIGFVSMVMSRVVEIWCQFLKQLNRLLIYRFEFLRLGSGISQWLGLSGAGSIETAGSSSNSGAVQGISMRDLSLTAAFVSERASMCNLAVQKCALFPLAWNLPCAMKQRLWLEVHALVLLIWVDVLLGVVFGYFVFTHAESIVQQAGEMCQQMQSTHIVETLQWFNHLPGGVKLNTTITQRMSSILTTAVLIFEQCLSATQPLHCVLLRFIACCGGFGCSVQLVMVVDLMRVLSAHIALIHRVLSYFHHFLLQSLHSLWLLFNGQKNNVLRKRIDTCYFGQDQLLFGIVQFSIVFFIFPNFAAYFFLFALAQFVCVAVQYVVYALSVLLKEFPYYEAVMFVTCPGIMSDGVQFSMKPPETPTSSHSMTCELSELQDSFNVNCLRDSWQTLSAPVVGGSGMLNSSSSSLPGKRAKTSPKHSLDARRRSLETLSGSTSSLQGSAQSESEDRLERHAESPTRGTTQGNNSTARPRGILKAASHRQSFCHTVPVLTSLSAQARDQPSPIHDSPRRNSIAERAGSRVTFMGNTVRTIEQYVSEDENEDTMQYVSEDENEDSDDHNNRKQSHSQSTSQGTKSAEESTPKLEPLMNSPRQTSKPPLTITSNARSVSTIPKSKPKHSSSGSTTYIDLKARSMSNTSLFVAYFNHMFYYSNERGMVFRLLRGIVTGRPALDIQLIHGTSDIVDRREATERALMLEVASLANSCTTDAQQIDTPHDASNFQQQREKEFPRTGSIPRAVWALRASPNFAESINLAWAGDDRQAFTDERVTITGGSPGDAEVSDSSGAYQETDSLLQKEHASSKESPCAVPRSLHCRTLSRRMLFILLLTLCISFLMSMAGMVMFVASSAFLVNSNSSIRSGDTATPLIPSRSRAVVAVLSSGRNTSEDATPIEFDKATSTSARIAVATAVRAHALSN
eukprot:gene13615-15665_t